MSNPGGSKTMPDKTDSRLYIPATLGIGTNKSGDIVLVATSEDGESVGAAMGRKEAMILFEALTAAINARGWLQ